MNTQKLAEIQSPKTNETLDFSIGLTDKQIDQLVKYSQSDAEVQKYTSDAKRFKDRDTFEERLISKPRTYYSLSDKDGNLAAIFWAGEEEIPERNYPERFKKQNYKLTFAIRTYGNYRGKGLSGIFLQKAFEEFQKTDEYKNASAKGFWLATHSDNQPAIRAYTEFGFEAVDDDGHQLVMVKE